MVEYWNQLPRHSGVFSGSHVLAYTMLFFSYSYCLALRSPLLKVKFIPIHNYFFSHSLHLLSLPCRTQELHLSGLLFSGSFIFGVTLKNFFMFP